MAFQDWIGFIITALALLYLFLRQVWQLIASSKAAERKKSATRHRPRLGDINLKEVGETIKKPSKAHQQKQILPLKPVVQKGGPKYLSSSIGEGIAPAMTHGSIRNKPSRGQALIQRLHSPQEMIILAEIIGPPRGMQK